MKPIVYLDIDGVLNNDEYIDSLPEEIKPGWDMSLEWWEEMIDPKRVEILNRLAENCYFVLSTSWRNRWSDTEMQNILNSRGFKGVIIGRTPRKMSSTRQIEIKWDIDDRKPERYVILDDLPLSFPGHFIQTNGITDEDVDKALEIIGGS